MKAQPGSEIGLTKFGVGQPVPRKEDPKLLRGEGRYTDDVNLPGQLYAVIVRSRVRASAASWDRYRGGEGNAGRAWRLHRRRSRRPAGSATCPGGIRVQEPRRLADAAAAAIAADDATRSAMSATRSPSSSPRRSPRRKDAAEAVLLDIDPLPAVTTARDAAAPGAPLVHDDAAGQSSSSTSITATPRRSPPPSPRPRTSRELEIRNSRVVVSPMEPRSAIGEYDTETGRWILHVGSPGRVRLRRIAERRARRRRREGPRPDRQCRRLLRHEGLRAIRNMSASCMRPSVLGRPVKWTDERSESFLSDQPRPRPRHGGRAGARRRGPYPRGARHGLRQSRRLSGNATALPPTGNTVKNSIGVYRTPAHGGQLPSASSPTRRRSAPTAAPGARRATTISSGCWMPPRRRWASTASSSAVATTSARARCHSRRRPAPPTTAAISPPCSRRRSRSRIGTASPRARPRASAAAGCAAAASANISKSPPPPTNEMGGIRFEPDGTVTIITGTLDYGQGHASPFAQVLTERLGIPFEKIRAAAGRQRPTDRRRRHRRLEVDHGERRRDRRGQRSR